MRFIEPTIDILAIQFKCVTKVTTHKNMPQVFQVLKCYKCSAFQIHQTKKSNKFECKMCGEKQSIKRHYGIGTGKDCRLHVQKLNMLRGNTEMKVTTESYSEEEYEGSETDEMPEKISKFEPISVKQSKWSEFIDKEKEIEATEEPMFLGNREVFLELPRKTKTHKIKIKTKTNNSEEYLHGMENFKGDLSNLRFSNENNSNNFEPEEKTFCNPKNNTTNNIIGLEDVICNNDNLLIEKSGKPVVNKNSRWAQYVNTDDDTDSHIVLSNDDSKECVLNSDNLFSLCDDNELDQVLDI